MSGQQGKGGRIFTVNDVCYEAARRGQRISGDGIRRAADGGRLQTFAVTERGVRLFDEAGVERWLATRQASGRSRTG
jgi:hypothetical protein